MIDAALGIGDGLLQRCCFFGQHSHTLQSLLGLTDVRLKGELSSLVDTELWQLALGDVRQRDRDGKQRLQELAVEGRLRREVLEKCQRDHAGSVAATTSLQTQLSDAIVAMDRETGGRASDLALLGLGQGASVAGLQEQVDSCVAAQEQYRSQVLGPLQREQVEALRQARGVQVAATDASIAGLRERLAQLQAVQASSNALRGALNNKAAQLEMQARTLQAQTHTLSLDYGACMGAWSARDPTPVPPPSLPSPSTSPSTSTNSTSALINPPLAVFAARLAQDTAVALLAACTAAAQAAQGALNELQDAADASHNSHSHNPTPTPTPNPTPNPTQCADHAHASEAEPLTLTHALTLPPACPTCGQALTPAQRVARKVRPCLQISQ